MNFLPNLTSHQQDIGVGALERPSKEMNQIGDWYIPMLSSTEANKCECVVLVRVVSRC